MSAWTFLYWALFIIAIYLYCIGEKELARDIGFANLTLILLPKNLR